MKKAAQGHLGGGLSAGHPTSEFDKGQLRKGIEVEKEHNPHLNIRREIAKDHLVEDPKYYDHLAEMEKKYKKSSAYILGFRVGRR
jgi:hypothetical protein